MEEPNLKELEEFRNNFGKIMSFHNRWGSSIDPIEFSPEYLEESRDRALFIIQYAEKYGLSDMKFIKKFKILINHINEALNDKKSYFNYVEFKARRTLFGAVSMNGFTNDVVEAYYYSTDFILAIEYLIRKIKSQTYFENDNKRNPVTINVMER
jgi:hypothetical protein